ncbi:MAG: PTS lactose/cellobiose transporter subunit IIA [Propionicimonas sp.]|uniref:PTS lactose/cellobiose transporter subunit IIA n=1 Tax=Propionicimonas sp. TaxID=1955623 RepID=UPI003D103A2E
MDDDLTTTAMTIILHAGDARSSVRKAYEALAAGDQEAATAALAVARDEIKQAHQAQTEVIQAEAAGAGRALTLLFSHAQDTLMTINSEVITANNLFAVFGAFERRLAALEAAGATA